MSDPTQNFLSQALKASIQDESFTNLLVPYFENFLLPKFKEELGKKDESIDRLNNQILKKDQTILEKEKIILERDQIILEKDQIILERNNIISENDKTIQDLRAQLAAKISLPTSQEQTPEKSLNVTIKIPDPEPEITSQDENEAIEKVIRSVTSTYPEHNNPEINLPQEELDLIINEESSEVVQDVEIELVEIESAISIDGSEAMRLSKSEDDEIGTRENNGKDNQKELKLEDAIELKPSTEKDKDEEKIKEQSPEPFETKKQKQLRINKEKSLLKSINIFNTENSTLPVSNSTPLEKSIKAAKRKRDEEKKQRQRHESTSSLSLEIVVDKNVEENIQMEQLECENEIKKGNKKRRRDSSKSTSRSVTPEITSKRDRHTDNKVLSYDQYQDNTLKSKSGTKAPSRIKLNPAIFSIKSLHDCIPYLEATMIIDKTNTLKETSSSNNNDTSEIMKIKSFDILIPPGHHYNDYNVDLSGNKEMESMVTPLKADEKDNQKDKNKRNHIDNRRRDDKIAKNSGLISGKRKDQEEDEHKSKLAAFQNLMNYPTTCSMPKVKKKVISRVSSNEDVKDIIIKQLDTSKSKCATNTLQEQFRELSEPLKAKHSFRRLHTEKDRINTRGVSTMASM